MIYFGDDGRDKNQGEQRRGRPAFVSGRPGYFVAALVDNGFSAASLTALKNPVLCELI